MNVVQNNSTIIDPALRAFVSALSDSPWSSPKARAKGMRKLAVAQLGSWGKIDSIRFVRRLAEQTIRRLLPPMLRQIGLYDVADRCEQEGTWEAALTAGKAADAAVNAFNAAVHAAAAANAAKNAAIAANYVAHAAIAAEAARNADGLTAHAAHYAAYAVRYANSTDRDDILTLMSDICIDVLREMKAPGIALMDQVC